MESKRNASSSGASCDGVSLCLYLAMIATFASLSLCINLYGYDFDNVSTKIYSLDHSTNCDNKIRLSKTIEEGSLIYADVQPEINLRFCMYEAAYTVSALKKSNVYDDVVFITKNSSLYYQKHKTQVFITKNSRSHLCRHYSSRPCAIFIIFSNWAWYLFKIQGLKFN